MTAEQDNEESRKRWAYATGLTDERPGTHEMKWWREVGNEKRRIRKSKSRKS